MGRDSGSGGLFRSFLWKDTHSRQLENPNERILNEYEFDFGERTGWVENIYWKDPALQGIGWGAVRIYSDSSKTDLLWQSPLFDGIFPYASWSIATTGMEGAPILLSEWGAGLHSSRYYPIAYIGGKFEIVPIQNMAGDMETGFFSDGGGLFPYPDGSIAVGRRTYEDLGEDEFIVYGFDGSKYFLERMISPQKPGDETPPVTQYSFDAQPNEDGWWNSPVILNLTASDNLEVLLIKVFTDPEGNKVIYSPRENLSLTFSEGRWNLRYQAVDWAGNGETLNDLEIKIDLTSPEISMLADGKSEINEYYSTPVTIDLQAEDPNLSDDLEGSGVKTIEYALGEDGEWMEYLEPFTVDGSGAHLIRYRATDLAGNISEVKETIIYVDQDPPDSGFAVIGCPENEGYFKCPIQIELDAEDYESPDGYLGSGVERIEYRLDGSEEWLTYTEPITLSTSGRYQLEFRAIDRAGNIEENDPLRIWLDLDPPVSSAVIIGEPKADGKYAPGAAVEITAKDPIFPDGTEGSGLIYIEFSLDSENNWQRYSETIVLEEIGLHTIRYRAVDLSGNIEETRSLAVEIVTDIEPPVVELFADPLHLWPPNNKLVPVRIFGTAFDLGSGIQSIHIEVVDEYGEWEPAVQDILPSEIVDGNWERTVELMASRRGDDEDGRKYTIIVTATDNLGNAITTEIEVIVPHDQGN
jgi:hypothetical protein